MGGTRGHFLCILSSLWLGACAVPEPTSREIEPVQRRAPEVSAQLELRGKVLLSKWTTCQMDAAVTVARNTIVDAADGVPIALAACKSERESWVDSQVAMGWNRDASERVADGAERCNFPIIQDQIEMTRRKATLADRQAYAIAHAGYSCPKYP